MEVEVSQTETESSESGSSWKEKFLQIGGAILTVLLFLAAVPVSILAAVLGAGLIISAPGVLIYQCFLWLREGEWVGLSATFFFKYFLSPDSPLIYWLDNPESWHGVHKLITATPLSVFLLLVGSAVFFVYFLVAEWMSAMGDR